MNTYCYVIYYILLETIWWALSNTSLIMWIHLVIHEILANKAFTVADGLISLLFVVTFVYPTYVQISLIWGFTKQLSLWKLVHWLWRYKLNEVCDTLLNENSNSIELYTVKGSPWLKFFGHSNSLCARATRAIINHASISEYQLRFFLWEEFKYSCSLYPIKSRHHILYECRHFNNYWNPNRELITYFTLFLEFNSSAFSFGDNTN